MKHVWFDLWLFAIRISILEGFQIGAQWRCFKENSYRFLTETCGLKILKSESGRTFRISNKIDISIMILLISDRALCCIIYASLWNIPGSGRSVRQSCLSSFERISIFFLNWVTLSKPIDSADMIYRFTDEPFSILEFYFLNFIHCFQFIINPALTFYFFLEVFVKHRVRPVECQKSPFRLFLRYAQQYLNRTKMGNSLWIIDYDWQIQKICQNNGICKIPRIRQKSNFKDRTDQG